MTEAIDQSDDDENDDDVASRALFLSASFSALPLRGAKGAVGRPCALL
jgi:hypothetical protein